MTSYIEHLISKLDNIKNTMFELLDNSRINHSRNESANFIFIAPDYHWDKPTEKEQQLQIKLKQLYKQWVESFNLLVENSPDTSKRKIIEVNRFVRDWIEKKSNWKIPRTIQEAKIVFEKGIEPFYATLSIYKNCKEKEIILIPDTNAFLKEPDPKNYKLLVKADKFTVVILPTVLSELDQLKVKSQNPNFQDKVKSVINRFKGYRNQGNLLQGITVEKTITIKMIAAEPNFNKSFSWLDSSNNDDRIIASALEIQKENTSAVVCILSGDINLQNKAEMANFPYLDI